MIPQKVSVGRTISGPDGVTVNVYVTVEFDPPLPLVPEKYDNVIKTEAQNAVVAIVERARK